MRQGDTFSETRGLTGTYSQRLVASHGEGDGVQGEADEDDGGDGPRTCSRGLYVTRKPMEVGMPRRTRMARGVFRSLLLSMFDLAVLLIVAGINLFAPPWAKVG